MTHRFCVQCGTALRPEAAFCAECGTPVAVPAAPPTPPATATPPAPESPTTRPARGRRPVLVALVALALVLVGGGTTAAVLLAGGDENDTTDRPGGRGPDVSSVSTIDRGISVLGEPASEWTLRPADVVPGGLAVSSTNDEMGDPAVWVLDDAVVAQVDVDEDGGRVMAGIEPTSGSVLWTEPAEDWGQSCWPVAEGATLACDTGGVDSGEPSRLELLDPRTGEVRATYDGWVSDLISTPQWVYAVRYDEDQDEGLHGLDVVRLAADDLRVDWEATATDPGTMEDQGNDFDGGTFLQAADGALTIDYGYLSWRLDADSGELLDQRSSYDYAAHSGGYEIDVEYGDESSQTRVRDAEGSTLLVADGYAWGATGGYVGVVSQGRVGVGPAVYDLATGDEVWSRPDLYDPEWSGWSWTPDHRRVLVDASTIDDDPDDGTTLLDGATGETIWHADATVNGWNSAFTADAVVTAADDGVLTVRPDDEDGVAWTRDLSAIGDGSGDPLDLSVAVGQESLLVYGYDGLMGLGDFDPDAVVRGGDDEQDGDGGTQYVTDCGSEPELTPVTAEAAHGGITVTYEVTATCPGGQWLSGSRQLVTLSVDGTTYLSGSFDLSATPYWVPGEGEDPLVLQLVHPFEGAFATVAEIAGAIESHVVHVDCVRAEDSYAGDVPADPADGADPSVPAPASGPGTDSEAAESALAALRRIAAADAAHIDDELAGRWLAQLSSKTRGTTDDGIVYDYDDVLALHLRLRARYDDVVLLNTAEWSSFKTRGLWVTLYGQDWGTSRQALMWCEDEGWDHGNCYAKRVTREGPPEGNTDLWPPGDG